MLSSFRRAIARIWAALHVRDLDQALDEELDAHISWRTRDLVQQGITPEDAVRMARIELGGVAQLREAHRDVRGLPFLETLFQDLRYAFRTLAKAPGFTAVSIATLALGIGITTVVFTAYAAVEFRLLSARAPEELVRFEWRSSSGKSNQFSWGEYVRLSEASHLFAPVFATSTQQTTICRLPVSSEPEEAIAKVRFVSSNYFAALGVNPQIGRSLRSDDRNVVLVSHDFWKTKLGADPGVYGRQLVFEGGALSIIGVAPESFTGTGAPPQSPDLWIPASSQSLAMRGVDWMRDDGAREWQVLAREKPAMRSQGAQELAAVSSRWPRVRADQPIKLSAAQATAFETNSGAFEGFAGICAILMGAVMLVLLIGCVNLTHLLAARNSGREQELALRLAVGASRSRLVRQLCAETFVLSIIGGSVGLLLSYGACHWLAIKAVELIRQITNGVLGITVNVSPDWHVFCWAAGMSLATGASVGILPAIRASNRDFNSTLKQGASGALGVSGTPRGRDLLLVAQVASCLILLAGAGLLLRGAVCSEQVSPGFDYRHLAVVGIDTEGTAQITSARVEVLQRALQRIQSIPAIVSVSWADRIPFLGTGSSTFQTERGASLSCIFNGVSDEYFDTVGIRLLAGRTFRREEIEQESPLAVISEATARHLWPGQNAIGKRLIPGTTWLRSELGHSSLTVVGVVNSIRSTYLSKDDPGYVYMPRRLHGGSTLFLVRTRTLPDRTFPQLAKALAGISPNLAARTFMSTMEQGPVRIQELMSQAPALVASVLGSLALLLACMGIHGVVSHFVARRTREIGIRIALGAAPWNVILGISMQTLQPVLWGAGAGLLGAFGVSGLLHALIVIPDLPDLTYGAGAFDALTFVCVFSLLAIVVLVAAAAPAWRATRVDASVALRND